MFRRVLIANRGVIACRIARTLLKLGIEPVAIYSETDSASPHVSAAAEAIALAGDKPAQTYLNIQAVLDAAEAAKVQAIHPGYGFLSENPDFADACALRGFVFIGPTAEQIRAFGLKNSAREVAARVQAPILPGTDLLRDVDDAIIRAAAIGYPVMLKSAGGGGGIGMRRCDTEAELREAYDSVSRLSETHFKGSGLFLERFVANGRHIEVQIFGDGRGEVISLGERDCSVQRRNQKIIEETPAPGLSSATRKRMADVAMNIARTIHYRSAGTVEFLYDTATDEFYFLEVNTRLQVEHGVTEEVTGVDLVEWMVQLADGSLPPLRTLKIEPEGASIQARVYAESPLAAFQPSSGRVTHFHRPADIRFETWIEPGTEVTPYFDPLLAKVIARGRSREEARQHLAKAIAETEISGLETNLDFLYAIVTSNEFATGAVATTFLNQFTYAPAVAQVLDGGVMTTIQDLPGRTGFWHVGVPPSGPMDALSFSLGNRLLGNDDGAPGLECTLVGPTLQFPRPTRIAITGADMQATIGARRLATGQAYDIAAGETIKFGSVSGAGARTYILFAGGLKVPNFLGSASTFTLGNFGGLSGRALRAGDTLPLHVPASNHASPKVSATLPELINNWTLNVAYGPHGAPDFFTEEDIETLFATDWSVHHNSSRTGVRLIGPKPRWARTDGGEAGLHPSNIHDNAYAVGSIDFTGDMPILLGPDGPSLGGFVCPGVVLHSDLWKMGQLSPGDTVRFLRADDQPAVLQSRVNPACQVRRSGDRNLLVEFGDPRLDLKLRFQAHALMEALQRSQLPGIIDLTPGIRSLQIHYDADRIQRQTLLDVIDNLIVSNVIGSDLDDRSTQVPSRIVHLPLSWDDPATRLAIERYMSSVRPDAPWCPSNLEFIRRINGLNSIEQVHEIVFNASYLVLGLGDVYLGAPVATPLDPRHRLVTTKYNPARTWTPENAVGIGGAYLCVYGMEGPGGYQFVGRTVQMWNTFRTTREFQPGRPWLLRFFDQIRFFPVRADELLDIRRDFPLGRYRLRIEESQFDLQQHEAFLRQNAGGIESFRVTQRQAFAEERERWAAQGEFATAAFDEPSIVDDHSVPEGCSVLTSPTTASVWSLEVKSGAVVQAGQRMMLLEAMKMEIAVAVPADAEIVEVLCRPGGMVTAGQPLLIYRPNPELT